ncbi:hypothetical protein [Rubrivirga sp.]
MLASSRARVFDLEGYGPRPSQGAVARNGVFPVGLEGDPVSRTA